MVDQTSTEGKSTSPTRATEGEQDMERPTLEEQIKASKATSGETAQSFKPTDEEIAQMFTPVGRVDLWIYNHCELLWHIIHWCWFDIWEGIEDADEHREWFIKVKRKLFGGNKEK